jgi:chromosome segregation ATPase
LHVVESSFVFLAVMAEAENKPTSFSHFTASSPSAEEKTDLTELASQADALSADLNKQRQHCGHESTSTEISNAAEELKLLACELRSLDTAVNANKDLYTEAFDQDLAEIQGHLGGIFEDIADCCKEMQKANGPNTSAVGWLAKKRYVKKLQKHLEANKTTLIVMRTVLHHGKEYGMHK